MRGTNPLPSPGHRVSGFGMMKTSKLRYNPGNLGDLLKHGWLVEIVRFLHRRRGGEPLHYADTFCGFAEYDVSDEVAQRIRDRVSMS